jgi:hypothetical protein
MTNICEQCGEYTVRREILAGKAVSVCPHCGHHMSFLRLPLFSITGPSGCGKTTACRELMRSRQDIVVFEGDVLWRDEFAPHGTLEFRNLCLRVAKNIGQSGRPVVLCGSSSPGEFEQCDEARYFSAIHYLALVAGSDVIEKRLKARPNWRRSGGQKFIETHQKWSDWFKSTDHVQDVTVCDTSDIGVTETVLRVNKWLDARIQSSGGVSPSQYT